ncbi:MAG: hypothetical protein K9H49_07770 [Bacteroidales bacterium]|nr:hypothetical protein [Bacteroidales bacterium]MCF8404530.1 hypothetical protein [Bacteroidales bacterium]
MKLIKYGVTLRRLRQEDIEMVRQARNSVRQYMEFKEFITPEMQLKWFQSIDNFYNFYYIIEYNGEKIGMINEKNMSDKIGEVPADSQSGIFLFDPSNYNSPAPVLASFILIEKGFYLFKDDISYIHVMRDNEKAIKYNKALGYELSEGQENVTNQKYNLTPENFEKKTQKLRKAMIKLSRSEDELLMVIEKSDYLTDLGQRLEEVNERLGIHFTENKNGDKVYKISLHKV